MWSPEELTYCSNVHQIRSLDELIGTVNHIKKVKNNLGLSGMGSGLWISNDISLILEDKAKLSHLINTLNRANISLFSLNGFPYNNFHSQIVKETVYSPDWSNKDRLTYTVRLATILSQALPENTAIGTISTLPLGYKKFWSDEQYESALTNIFLLCHQLDALWKKTGKRIIVCLEMEPGCVLESTTEIIDLFRTRIPRHFKQNNFPTESLERHLGICFDVCHQAVMFENCYESLTSLKQQNINIAKIQISSALEVRNNDINKTQQNLLDFDEKKYLHQTYTRHNDSAYGVSDLSQAFKDKILTDGDIWRIHYHVPVQMDKLKSYDLSTTQSSILDTLKFLRDNPDIHPHIEVETYTWHVLPKTIRPENDEQLQTCLSNELNWLKNSMSRIGLIK